MKRNRSALITLLIAVITILTVVPLFTVQADFGTNWTGTFYNDTTLGTTGAIGVQVSGINGLNFDWGAERPVINGVKVPITNCLNS